MNSSILIIDDDPRFVSQMKFALTKEGYDVRSAETAASALVCVREQCFDCAIIDVQLPDVFGIALTEQMKQISPLTEIIIMTAFGTIEDGVKAMKAGAMDYSVKTGDLEHTLLLVQRACEKAALAQRVEQLVRQLDAPHAFASIIGTSAALQKAVQLAQTIAPTDVSVLILGETGTGKELFARAIHDAGLRKHRDFVAINCSAIPADLLESELFGYRKGAFTGAFHDKVGLLAKAGEGTLFLDEIGDMPPALQTKILRVLETRECTPLGGTESFAFQARVIAATNADIFQKISLGSFRSDLYYRLEGFVLELPPLRERKEDIDILTQYFVTIFSTKYKKHISRIHEHFQKQLREYPWYGNVREFRNVVERAVLLCSNGVLTNDILALSTPQARFMQSAGGNQDALRGVFSKEASVRATPEREIPPREPSSELLFPQGTPPRAQTQQILSQQIQAQQAQVYSGQPNHSEHSAHSATPLPSSSTTFATEVQAFSATLEQERNALLEALWQTNGDRSKAAKLLNISIATLYRKLKKYHLEHYGKRFDG